MCFAQNMQLQFMYLESLCHKTNLYLTFLDNYTAIIKKYANVKISTPELSLLSFYLSIYFILFLLTYLLTIR